MSLTKFKSRQALTIVSLFFYARTACPSLSQLTWPCSLLLYAFFLSLSFVRSSLFIHAGFLVPLLDFLHIVLDGSWAWMSSANYPAPVFSAGPYPMGFSGADPWIGWILLSWSLILLFTLFSLPWLWLKAWLCDFPGLSISSINTSACVCGDLVRLHVSELEIFVSEIHPLNESDRSGLGSRC